MKDQEYINCKRCKHVCYDEPVTTCNHLIGFGPDGECPIYGDDEEETECFIRNNPGCITTMLKWLEWDSISKYPHCGEIQIMYFYYDDDLWKIIELRYFK